MAFPPNQEVGGDQARDWTVNSSFDLVDSVLLWCFRFALCIRQLFWLMSGSPRQLFSAMISGLGYLLDIHVLLWWCFDP